MGQSIESVFSQAAKEENKEHGNLLPFWHLQFHYRWDGDRENGDVTEHVDDSYAQVKFGFIDGAMSFCVIVELQPVVRKRFAV